MTAGRSWAGSRGHVNCVFFTQHSAEKRSASLWEGAFFIAPKTLLAKVMAATEGGIPMSRYPVGLLHRVAYPKFGNEFGSIAW